MEKKRTIIFQLDLLFDIRQFIETGIINRVAKKYNVVLLLRPYMIDEVNRKLKNLVTYKAMIYWKYDLKNVYKYFKQIRNALTAFLSEVFRLTYANIEKKKNRTRRFHISTSLKKARECGKVAYIKQKAAVLLSNLTCRSFLLRKILRTFRYVFLTPRCYREYFQQVKPKLVVTCSLCLLWDHFFMSEARKAKIPVISAVQSWDKTSTKGAPGILPDYVTVWSNVMKQEVITWHDIPAEKIFVGGVPEWSQYFDNSFKYTKEQCKKDLNLKMNKKTIYFALCSNAFHQGNMDTVRCLIDWLKNDRYNCKCQLLLRVHPGYCYYPSDFSQKRSELFSFLEKYHNMDDVHIDYPALQKDNVYAIPKKDLEKLKKIFTVSDVCISVASTQMIEAAIFNKPAITIEYGEWKTNLIETPMHKVRYEHLMRIYKVKSVLHARSPEMLLEQINESLENPLRYKKQRLALINQEIPVNRADAAEKIAEYIISIANCKNIPHPNKRLDSSLNELN